MGRLLLVMLFVSCATRPPQPPPPPLPQPPPPARQNPSPMVDSTRAHERLERRATAGRVFTIDDVLPKPVEVLVTPAAANAGHADLVIHFHGSSWLPFQAAEATGRPLVIAAINLGAGSRRYSMPFEDPAVFQRVRDRIAGDVPSIRNTWLTAFSAGYGAVRAILGQQPDAIDGVLLLDGLHASYIPDAKPVAEGGVVDTASLEPFVRYAQRAVAGETRFVVTHSEIFPGTFASTTETADHLLGSLDLKRTPVLQWGPLGMQQLSDVRRGSFHVLGFAGNTAPDHVDHLQAYQHFLELLLITDP
ncbi:MAG TPA: hypothetical protein VFT12_05635 [Thermoanaerobaculia bacterium]|nr:hypothetical protein [Thermoanaerobaculia bacterium]